MKTLTLFILGFAFITDLYGQITPILCENDLVSEEDYGKKPGWIKVKLDSNFIKTSHKDSTKYVIYNFDHVKGGYTSTFSHPLGVLYKNKRMLYKRTNQDEKSKLLNGIVEAYDKQNRLLSKYTFKDGFLIKIYHYGWNRKFNGKLKTLIEFIPVKDSVELFANYFNNKGEIIYYSHEMDDGYKFIPLPRLDKNIAQ